MRARTKVIRDCNWIQLQMVTSAKTGRKHYTVKYFAYKMGGYVFNVQHDLNTLFNPNGNRGAGNNWKFSNRKEAESLLTMAILRWGDGRNSQR